MKCGEKDTFAIGKKKEEKKKKGKVKVWIVVKPQGFILQKGDSSIILSFLNK